MNSPQGEVGILKRHDNPILDMYIGNEHIIGTEVECGSVYNGRKNTCLYNSINYLLNILKITDYSTPEDVRTYACDEMSDSNALYKKYGYCTSDTYYNNSIMAEASIIQSICDSYHVSICVLLFETEQYCKNILYFCSKDNILVYKKPLFITLKMNHYKAVTDIYNKELQKYINMYQHVKFTCL